MSVLRAHFDVDVDATTPEAFARLSGDWNPLHTDPEYARNTVYGRPILHGAFAAGLVSRMAGMHLPGTDCLLHGMRLRFIAPVVPPQSLRVEGEVLRQTAEGGSASVVITDRASGRRLVEAAYDYGLHRRAVESVPTAEPEVAAPTAAQPVLVTGATGGLGRAVVQALGDRALGGSRSGGPGMVRSGAPQELDAILAGRRLGAIVHCAWPAPDNTPLIRLTDLPGAIGHHVAEPLAECIGLARILRDYGAEGAILILVGSTASLPGRHGYRKPLYSLAKGMIPTLTAALAVELGGSMHRCAGVIFDALDGGMNAGMSATARVAHADRSPFGLVPTMEDAARQVLWLLDNPSPMASGSVMILSGGSLP